MPQKRDDPEYAPHHYYYGQLIEQSDKVEAVNQYSLSFISLNDPSYLECIRLDREYLAAYDSLFRLHPFSSTKRCIDELSASSLPRPISHYEKHILYYKLCETHPYLLPSTLFHIAPDDSENVSVLLSIAKCYRERGNLASSDLVFDRILHLGVLNRAILIERCLLFYQMNAPDRLFLFIHSLPSSFIYSEEYSYALGVYSLLRRDYYQALQHLNLALTRNPLFWEAWIAIGLVRSALVASKRSK